LDRGSAAEPCASAERSFDRADELQQPHRRVAADVEYAAVAPEDRERFSALTRAELSTLHEGNAIRFGLRPPEFAAWKKHNPPEAVSTLRKSRHDSPPAPPHSREAHTHHAQARIESQGRKAH
jgi:hypothetical protein